MKAKFDVLSNIACTIMQENMNEFGNTHPDTSAFDDMQFAIDIKRALAAGKKKLVIEIVK